MVHSPTPQNEIKFLLLEGINQSALDTLNNAGFYNITRLNNSLNEDDLIRKIEDVNFIGIRSRTVISEEVIKSASKNGMSSKLMGIGCFCIGTNHVDLDSARKNGIPVFNAPFSNTRSVAELVLAEMIMLMRGVPQKNAAAHRGIWSKSAKKSHEIRGKTLGIIGYGNIGSQLGIMAESLGMNVFFYDINAKLSIGNAKAIPNLDTLLSKCDIISLHVPESELTKYMIRRHEFKKMKKDSILINAARGNIVDIDALYDALKTEHLLGAAIDVSPNEPPTNHDSFKSPLKEFDNVILTPHIGGSTEEAQFNIGKEVADKLIRYYSNGDTITSVNFPEVSLPSHPGVHRLLHIHKNLPGVLSKINQIFSKNHININSQYLKTKKDIGYVIVDIDAAYSEVALQEISKIEETIKARVIF